MPAIVVCKYPETVQKETNTMAKFLFIYLDPVTKKSPELSPEEMQTQMKLWWDWLGNGKEAGWVVEMGDALQPEIRVMGPDHSITDGPHPESKEFVGGYSVIEADDFDQACEHAKGCPIFKVGGSVEVRAVANLSPPS